MGGPTYTQGQTGRTRRVHSASRLLPLATPAVVFSGTRLVERALGRARRWTSLVGYGLVLAYAVRSLWG